MSALLLVLLGMLVLGDDGQGGTRAFIKVRVPVEAKLYFNEVLTKQTGVDRNFFTPELDPSQQYDFSIHAEWMDSGKLVSETRNLKITAGQKVEIIFPEWDQLQKDKADLMDKLNKLNQPVPPKQDDKIIPVPPKEENPGVPTIPDSTSKPIEKSKTILPEEEEDFTNLLTLLSTGGGLALLMKLLEETQRKRRPQVSDPNQIISSHPLGGNPNFKRGFQPTPPHVIAALVTSGQLGLHKPAAAPTQFGIVPSKLSMWLNDTYGDCVSAEECYFIACMTALALGQGKEVVISDAEVKAFCTQFGLLNGADLAPVIQDMEQTGITDGGNTFKDGQFQTVDYTKASNLCSAMAQGVVVKIAIDANALPQGAGNANGWYAFGGSPGQFSNTDHCVGLSAYGTATYCFGLIGVPVPAKVDPAKPDCRILFTWSTVGVVDDAWIMSTVVEAYIRDSLLMNGTPLTPTPTPVPVPPIPVPPTPTPGTFTAPFTLVIGGLPLPLLSFPDQASAISMAQMIFSASPTITEVVMDSSVPPQVVQSFPPTPVPPVPPVPPTPTPGVITLQISANLTAGTYEIMPAGTKSKFQELATMINSLGQ